MDSSLSCWCGNADLRVFSSDYVRCAVCETLVTTHIPAENDLLVHDDERNFYGKHYFERMARDHGQPPLQTRARADLQERCLHWLRGLLKYKLPPGRILELGSAHGGFVALLRWTGFDATGLDLSPTLVDLARRTFDVPMLVGGVEFQNISPASLDAIVFMDVLEHLRDPVGTLRHCLGLLTLDGIFLLQTPQYREGKTLAQMQVENDSFLQQLRPEQHLYLFSKSSVRRLFRAIGVENIEFEPAIFSGYDMFLAAGRQALVRTQERAVTESLESRAPSRLSLALLDLDQRFQELNARYAESEADRVARLRDVHALQELLEEAQADRANRLENIHTLEKLLTETQSNLIGRTEKITALGHLLAESSAASAELALRLKQAHLRVAQYEAQIDQQATGLREPAEKLHRTQEEDSRRAAVLRGLLASAQESLSQVQAACDAHAGLLDRIRLSYVFRLMRTLGLWKWLDSRECSKNTPSATDPLPRRELKRVVIDLTPMLPGGENGGAKVMTLELIRHLGAGAPDCEFILLTSEKSHDELAALDARNIRRICVNRPDAVLKSADYLATEARRLLARFLSAGVLEKLAGIYREVSQRAPFGDGLVRKLNADLLFCPFTAPFFFAPGVLVVSVVYDLQHVYYPQFFEPSEAHERDRNFRNACRVANRIVCISEYVRKTVLKHTTFPAERVETIHIQFPRSFRHTSPAVRMRVLDSFGLQPETFLLYPANFWPHKNHDLLLSAFGMYRAAHPQSDLRLVLTGAPGRRRDELIEASRRMNLAGAVVFPGYLPDEELSALIESCLAVIFPSLFEGFGIPLLEAMAAGKPLLSSNATSLPEVAGDAALYFDPRRPAELVSAMSRIEEDPDLRRSLVENGARRLATFGKPEEMASRYLRVFNDVICQTADLSPGVYGVFVDNWVGERFSIIFGCGAPSRKLVIRMSVPNWVPMKAVSVRLHHDGASSEVHAIPRGERLTINQPLGSACGVIEIQCSPTFQPKAYGIGDDARWLTCQCPPVEIIDADGTTTQLENLAYAV
jgi:glycosyltransferase involved in cell wall biosynthesis/SAM-dependent methyltransferase